MVKAFKEMNGRELESARKWTIPLMVTGFALTPVASIPELKRSYYHASEGGLRQKVSNLLASAAIVVAQAASSVALIGYADKQVTEELREKPTHQEAWKKIAADCRELGKECTAEIPAVPRFLPWNTPVPPRVLNAIVGEEWTRVEGSKHGPQVATGLTYEYKMTRKDDGSVVDQGRHEVYETRKSLSPSSLSMRNLFAFNP